MKSMQKQISKLLTEESGQSLTEYGLVAALMALVTVATVGAISNGITHLITSTIAKGVAAWPS